MKYRLRENRNTGEILVQRRDKGEWKTVERYPAMAITAIPDKYPTVSWRGPRDKAQVDY